MEDDQALSLPRGLILGEVEVRKCKQSKEEVVSALYETLRPSLLSYAFHYLGSMRDAEDLVQIAFLQLFDQLSHRPDIRNPRGWIFRAVHSLAINHTSRASRRESLIRDWFADASEVDDDTAEDRAMRRQEIERALELLSEKERHCLLLRSEGLSYLEIAEVLEISAKSVSVYLARGLKKFEGAR